MKDLWVEKYRPKTVEEYVFRDNNPKRPDTRLDRRWSIATFTF